jgi:hypothetical protein
VTYNFRAFRALSCVSWSKCFTAVWPGSRLHHGYHPEPAPFCLRPAPMSERTGTRGWSSPEAGQPCIHIWHSAGRCLNDPSPRTKHRGDNALFETCWRNEIRRCCSCCLDCCCCDWPHARCYRCCSTSRRAALLASAPQQGSNEPGLPMPIVVQRFPSRLRAYVPLR